MGKEDDKRERKPISGNGAQISKPCAICGVTLNGRVWDYSTLSSMYEQADSPTSNVKTIGYACGNCGYAYCYRKHKKELEALSISIWCGGPCPDCGEMVRGDNLRYILPNA